LPPKGAVGPKGKRLRAYAEEALNELRTKGAAGVADAIKELEAGIAQFDKNA
jgi:hypothetical protein